MRNRTRAPTDTCGPGPEITSRQRPPSCTQKSWSWPRNSRPITTASAVGSGSSRICSGLTASRTAPFAARGKFNNGVQGLARYAKENIPIPPEVADTIRRILDDKDAPLWPLDAKTRRLIKFAIAIGASFDSAARSHARRALHEDGISAEELRHVALLAITTTGWSRGVAALDWIERVEAE